MVTEAAARWLASATAGLAELVLPGGCAGCGGADGRLRYGACGGCAAALARLRPGPTRPDPAPVGLPPCAALGDYDGLLRELVLAYKDRGRHRLARPLGRLLAEVVVSVLAAESSRMPDRGRPGLPPVLLVPVPDSPAAARARHGDHLRRLARPAVTRLRAAGLAATVAGPLRAISRPDSTGLDQLARAEQAQAGLRIRPLPARAVRQRLARTGESVILLDDVVTTGATLAAATSQLAAAGIPVAGAALLAATRRTHPAAG